MRASSQPKINAADIVRKGLALHQQKRLSEAEALYRQALALAPGLAEAHHLLGVAALQGGRLAEAVASARRAIALKADQAPYHYGLANALKETGDLSGAEAAYQEVIRLKRDFPEAWLGLGNLAQARGEWQTAADGYATALKLRPGDPDALLNLGTALAGMGKHEQAIDHYRRALTARPDFAEAESNLGLALKRLGKHDEAMVHVRRAIDLKPDYPDALNNLGNLLAARHQHGAAVPLYRQALALRPDYGDAHYNLANTLTEWCQFDEAIAHYRACLAREPGRADAQSNLLFTLNYHDGCTPQELFDEYRRWGDARPKPAGAAHPNLPTQERRLRVGYVSADFNRHVCHYFFEPLLEWHDRDGFELYAYSASNTRDYVTERLRQKVEQWRDCANWSDAVLAEQIRRDGIDILIDLAGHTRGNRLAAFALKPAPVQVTWLGFGYTTGLPAIDYFLTDADLVPDNEPVLLAEQPWRLPRVAFCYRPPEKVPEPGALPAQARGYVTFGTLSRTIRLNAHVIALWARILQAVPGSRLVIDQRAMSDPATQAIFSARFAAHGIAPERLVLTCSAPHWNAYHGIDIALDPFPHNAGTTTLEALWMGVPVISLRGSPPLGRLGATLLHALDMGDWLADSEEEYLAIAVRAAEDLPALAKLRASLRARIEASPLRDERGFTRAVEAALRNMWRRWCATAGERQPSLAELLRAGLARHQNGDLAGARQLYLRMLAIDPAQGDALNLLGVLAYGEGDFTSAEDFGRRAVATDPAFPAYLMNLGSALAAQGRHEEASTVFRQVLERAPGDADAHYNLANSLSALGQTEEAMHAYRAAIQLRSAHFDASNNLARLLLESGQSEEAREVFRQALMHQDIPREKLEYLARSLLAARLYHEAESALRRVLEFRPDDARIWLDLRLAVGENRNFAGVLHWVEKRLEQAPEHVESLLTKAHAQFWLKRYPEAETACRKALELQPAFPEALNLLGVILSSVRRHDEALIVVEKAIAQDPAYEPAYVTRGEILRSQQRYLEAIASLRKAVELEPSNHTAWANLGTMEADLANFAAGQAACQRALDLVPGHQQAVSNRLFALNYDPDITSDTLFDAYRQWASEHTPPYVLDNHRNKPNPNRRLKVGYLSADFGNHVVRYFMEHLIELHDPREFDLVLYDNTDPRDQYNGRFRGWAEHWCDARALSDDALASQIVKDQIDILVDLSGHTGGHRLPVLARKPAPVQVTYLGYGYTTGLEAVDYFLADQWFVPAGAERWFAEKIHYLPRSMYCYRPPEGVPAVQTLPALKQGQLTFGSLSRPIRFNARVIRVWAEILAAVPGSRLILDNKPFADPGVCKLFHERFAAHGIAPERLMLRYTKAYWPSYHDIDIALDPFPHNAGTTSVEALWMGVPVLSLEDRPPLGRFGSTLLHAVGLNDWLAGTDEEYVAKAVAFSQNLAGLSELRAGLRARMERSPLRDEKGFVRMIESAYRKMWKKWCAQQKK